MILATADTWWLALGGIAGSVVAVGVLVGGIIGCFKAYGVLVTSRTELQNLNTNLTSHVSENRGDHDRMQRENREDHGRIFSRLDNHNERIIRLEPRTGGHVEQSAG